MCKLDDAAACEWQSKPWRNFYQSDFFYGRGTVYAFLIGIGAPTSTCCS